MPAAAACRRKGDKMRELSIYIHIPFCVRKCLYCDFLSAPAGEKEIKSYVNLLLREIKEQSVFYGDHRVVSIFLGGGTPSLLPETDVGRILEQIGNCYSMESGAEITLECNPGTVTAEKLKDYITSGINRLSIGLQSADDGELARIGRIHGCGDFLETYRLAREAGFDNINVDLMAGLPGQSPASYRRTLERVVSLSPEHISSYSLILEEGTPIYVNQSSYSFPTEEEDREMYEFTGRYLDRAGYRRYEISNYAKEGFACRHNTVYWRRGDYAGFGLGASSMVGNVRWKNPQTHEAYTAYVENMKRRIYRRQGGNLTCAGAETSAERGARMERAGADEVQVLTVEEQMEEFMFLGLRLTEGIDLGEFRRIFGKSADEVYGKTIAVFEDQGLLVRKGGRLALTLRGIDVSNVVFAAFLF